MRRSLPVVACLLALLLPAAASAHARLEGTEPPQGAVVKKEPAAVIFEFDEPVEGNFVSSGYVFSIGKEGKAPTETVGELIGGSGNGKMTEVAYGIARGLEYA